MRIKEKAGVDLVVAVYFTSPHLLEDIEGNCFFNKEKNIIAHENISQLSGELLH